jgi:8-oxo-dGTP pyrophosphatase MutT (NUDIX family)
VRTTDNGPGGPGVEPSESDRRSALEAELRLHRPADPRESLSLEILAAELERLPRPFDRHADPTHVTASAIVIGSRGVVLHRHRRLHRWLQPGGHVDAGESPPETAVRETLEETGVTVRHPTGGPALIHVDVHTAAAGHVHLDLRYLLWGSDEDPDPAPGESREVAWFSWDDAEELADAPLAGALVAARRLTAGQEGRSDRQAEEEG